MILSRLQLTNFRNYAELNFEPAPGLNLIVGANAQGKSNLLEAIGMLGIGKSFRTSRESELVRVGSLQASVAGDAQLVAGLVRLACSLELRGAALRKQYGLNGYPVRYAGYLGQARVVTFSPADLQLVGGPPSIRRAFLNAALAQQHPTYYQALGTYGKVLAAKGALLRGHIEADAILLATYNQRLVDAGSELIVERHAFAAALASHAAQAYAAWADVTDAEGPLQLRYVPNVAADRPDRESVRVAFAQRLAAAAAAEMTRRMTLVGPHRDELDFVLGGRALASFGSQGQRRSAVLALKLAEYAVLRTRGGEAPILLLDDVLSELDHARQRALIATIATFEQTFVTMTARAETPAATLFRVVAAGQHASVERVA